MKLPQKSRDPVEIGRKDFEENNPNPAVFQDSFAKVFGYEPELGERVKIVIYTPEETRQNAWWVHGFLFTHVGGSHAPLYVQDSLGGWSMIRSAKQFYEMYKDGFVIRDE